MLKMLIDPMGSIVLTNDGHCILREVDVSHPTAKSMIELSRAQDEEVGDGTTSVIVLAAEVLGAAAPFLSTLQDPLHPIFIVQAYRMALEKMLQVLPTLARTVNLENKDDPLMKQLVQSSLGTKFSNRWNSLMVDMALKAVLTVTEKVGTQTEVDIKRFAKVEKIPGGEIGDCEVLKGVMFQKDTVHSAMRRKIVNPRILLLDTPLEYKKGETQTHMEIDNQSDWNALLQQEEEYVRQMCQEIIAFKPDIVITEKGVSDLAQHYLNQANITAFRRLRKTDNNRVARAVGATIVSRTDEIQETDIGTGCGLFEMKYIGNDWFCCLAECTEPKACTIVLRGGSKDVLNELERNLQDAMQVIRNVVSSPELVPGGGATEMALSVALSHHVVGGIWQAPLLAIAEALQVIPRTLAQNAGVHVLRTVAQLRAKHEAAYEKGEVCTFGIQGHTGELVDMMDYGIWEPLTVKRQTIQTALESACMIIRIDDIVSGSKQKA
jgi:T-complex protein 1 subunit gamma